MKEVQDKLQAPNDQGTDVGPSGDNGEEPTQHFINLLEGEGKGKGKNSKGPNGINGACFNCGEHGHYAANRPKPEKEGIDKGNGKGKGKFGKGINSFVVVFKPIGLHFFQRTTVNHVSHFPIY